MHFWQQQFGINLEEEIVESRIFAVPICVRKDKDNKTGDLDVPGIAK